MSESQYNDPDQMREFQALWDAASGQMEDEPIHPKPARPTPEVSPNEILDERRRSSGEGEMPWRDMLLVADNIDKIFGEGKEEVKDMAQQGLRSPNPIEPWTAGKDQKDTDTIVTPNFTDGDALRELSNLRIRVEMIERDLHSAHVVGTKKEENKLQKEVDSIRLKIEELSEKLAPRPFEDRE